MRGRAAQSLIPIRPLRRPPDDRSTTRRERVPDPGGEPLSRTHHEHELYYSQAPLEAAVAFQRLSRTLKALAGHWLTTEPLTVEHAHRYAGCDDLNVQAAIETLGVLFQEGEGEPAEIGRIKRELTTQAEDHEQTGAWLGAAMQSTWKSAAALLQIEPLADLLGERHRIIAANWQNASLNVIIAALLRRAVEILEIVDFAPAAIRVDLADRRLTPHYLFAAAELIDRAADLLAEGAVLVHDSERRWRVFHARIEAIRDDTPRQLRDEEPDARRQRRAGPPGLTGTR